MDAFTAGILQRIRATESVLSEARESGDDFLVEVEESELDDLRRLAAEHGVDVGASCGALGRRAAARTVAARETPGPGPRLKF
jgi:cysteine synthase